MSQYRTGTVSVTNGSATVTGSGTSWLTNVEAGDLFKVKSENVIYTIASVNSNTQLTLSTNYAGSTASGLEYQIVRDFTPNLSLPEVSPGDIDWPVHLTQSLRKIDNAVGQNVNNTSSPTFSKITLASSLDNRGSTGLSYTTITSSATAGDYTTYFINCASGQVTLTLPSASSYPRRIYNIIRVANSIYNCIIATTSSQTINGEYSWSLELYGEGITVQSDGSNWIIIGRN